MVTEEVSLAQLPDALTRLDAGEVVGRAVVIL